MAFAWAGSLAPVWIGDKVITEDSSFLGIPHRVTSALKNACRSLGKLSIIVVTFLTKLEYV
jgi:hypothetical protein